MNIPNYLTLFRILMIPLFVLVFYLPWQFNHLLSALIFTITCLTDWLDGYLARALDATSPLGRFLDPVADKLVVAVALVFLVAQPYLPYISLPVAIIIGREIIISALREWMAEIGKRTSVAVSYVGKIKTFLQMTAITGLLLYHPNGSVLIRFTAYFLLYVSTAMTLWSMLMYIKAAWPELMRGLPMPPKV